MIVKPICQPETPLGNEISGLLESNAGYSRIIFVSAFTALRTILRLRDKLLLHAKRGTKLKFIVGIDLGGTSREVLHELLRWNCKTFVFHNALVRVTFHTKLYLFESKTAATLFIGSNNLTDGGLYSNYEAATRYEFKFPKDLKEYTDILQPLNQFLNPEGTTVQPLNDQLIRTLVARGELPSEAEARKHLHRQNRLLHRKGLTLPNSPFGAILTQLPPLLPTRLRTEESTPLAPEKGPSRRKTAPSPQAALVWRKILPKTDALQVAEGSNPVGGVRLVQAAFKDLHGKRISQTTYFRQLFADYEWEHETGKYSDQEHTFIPMHIFIRGKDYGIRNFEISHKPSGEAGQHNYTTILRWGKEFSQIVRQQKLANTVFSLYETDEPKARFLIEITNQ